MPETKFSACLLKFSLIFSNILNEDQLLHRCNKSFILRIIKSKQFVLSLVIVYLQRTEHKNVSL